MTKLTIAALLSATITVGLMAGLFAAFAYAVMPGLARTGDATFVNAMQRINVAILNGWFGICFAGGALFAIGAVIGLLGSPDRAALGWTVAGLVLYCAVLVITFAINVPLNNQLDAAGDPALITDPAAVRAVFEDSWVRWNLARAVLNTAAFGCLCLALLSVN